MRLLEAPWLVAKGFCMGMADLVPGVSGGTMAFILGIYEQLLAAIRSFDRVWLLALFRFDAKVVLTRPHFHFIIPLLIGIFSAIFFFTHVISLPELIKNEPELIYGLFFGLILASIIVLMKEMRGFNTGDALTLALGIAAGLVIVNTVPQETPDASWFIFLSGVIAISAMILPGLSGSFLLLLLRKYSTIITGLGELNFAVVIPFALGCLTGLVVFSRVLGWLLAHFYQRTLLVIKGILIASLWMLWPFQQRIFETIAGKEKLIGSIPQWPASFNEATWASFSLMLIGLVVVLVINRVSKRAR